MSRVSFKEDGFAKGKAELKSFMKFIRYGETWKEPSVDGEHKASFITPQEYKLLRTDDNVQGGFLVPEDFVAEILKLITELSPIRQIARIRQTSSGELVIPTRETLVNAEFIGENATKTESNSTYGENRIKVNKLVSVVTATVEMLNDSAFNMEEEMREDVVESFAEEEGKKYVNGNSVNEPEGFMFNTSITAIPSGVANEITSDSLIQLTGELKSGQNPMFLFNRRTLATIRQLKDLQDAYVFNLDVGLSKGLGPIINGSPYLSVIDMPDIAVDSFPVIFGDFRRGYTIVDGFSMTMIRDPFTFSNTCKVRFVWKRQTGAQVVLVDAFKKLKIAVSI